MRPLNLQEERDGPPTQSMNTQLRVKKTRKLSHIGPKAKKTVLLRRMRSIANTRQRKEKSLKAAVKAEKRVGGQKAEKSLRNTKVMTGEVSQGAKTEMLIKKRSQNLIKIKIEIRAKSLIKSIKRIPKEEMVRELGQSLKARKEQLQKMDTDQVAGTGKGVDLQYQKTKKKNEKRTEGGGAENVAGVRKDDTTAKGRIRGAKHPGIRNFEQEVQIETSQETRTEAGAPGARVTRETTAKTGHLIERTETEKLPTKGENIAAALRMIETTNGRVKKAQNANGAEQKVLPNPKTEEARQNQDRIVQKAETETTARGINQALALTATEPVMRS